MDPGGHVNIGGKTYGEGALSLVVVNRENPQDVQTFGFANRPVAFDTLKKKIEQFSDHWLDIVTAPAGLVVTRADAAEFNKLVVTPIGGEPLDAKKLADSSPLSVVGVRQWTPGTAYENLGARLRRPGAATLGRAGALAGYLQRNPATQAVGFVFPDYPSFDTRVGTSPTQLTMRIADVSQTFTFPSGQSGFALLVLDRRGLGVKNRTAFVTNSGNVATDGPTQRRMGKYLQSDVSSDQLVVIESFGFPRPTAMGWNDLALGIQKVGGNPNVVNALNGKVSYALITVPGISGDSVESVSNPVTRETGSITGVLTRDHTAGFAPLLSDPTGHPTLVNLLQLAYGQPSSWPDRDTEGRRAAIRYISQQLGFRVADPNLEYTNLTVDFGSAPYYGKLERMTYPGGTQEFSTKDFTDVKAELLDEFLWVSKVRGYTDKMRQVMDESVIIRQDELSKLADTIKDKSGAGGKKTSVNAYQIYSDLFTVAKALNPEFGAAASAISTAFKVAGALTKDNGTDVLGNFTVATNDLAHQLVSRYVEGLTSLGLLRSIIVTDYGKLKTAATNIIDKKPGWVWEETTTAMTLRDMTLSTKRFINEALLPTVYVAYRLPGEWQDASSCRVLSGEPASAWVLNINGFAGSGGNIRPLTQVWAIGTRQQDDRSGQMKASADLIDPLFLPIPPDSTDRLGLSKLDFITHTTGSANLGSHYCNPL